jgi:hypothetical protein
LRDGENGRYRWLTSATKKNPEGATPHLDGELPLAVFEPSEYRGDAIWLPEGLGAKPSITRYRLGVPVVGASSGLFSSSPNTSKATLEKLSAKYQTQKLVIPLDGGDVKNPHVCQRWLREFEFLRALGYELAIAWWGQWTKDDADIDELCDLSSINFITPEDFLCLESEEIGNSVSKKASSKEVPQPIFTPNQQRSKGKSHQPGNSPSSTTNRNLHLLPQSTTFGILNPPLIASFPTQLLKDGMFKVLPIPKSVASCLPTEEKAPRQERKWFEKVLKRVKKVFLRNIKNSKAPRLGFKCYKEDNPDFEEKIRQVQRKLRSLSYEADVELCQRYLPNELAAQLPKSGLIGIKAPKGCGKSVLLKKIIALAKKQGIPVLSITPRIALGREQAIKWEVTWIDDYGVMQTRAGDTTRQIQELAQKRSEAKETLAELEGILYQQLNLLDETEILKREQQKVDLKAEIERYGQEIDNINTAAVTTLALCWDSIWRTENRDMENALIIIDEAELGIKHFVTGSTCRRNRPHLLKVFADKIKDCLMSGGRVILSDADLTNLSIDYIRQLLPVPLNPFILKNEYIGDETRWIVDFRTGSRGNTLDEILENIEMGYHLAITADSQAEAVALEEKILSKFPDFCAFVGSDKEVTQSALARKKPLVVRLDSKTAETEAGKKFIQKPNESILDWKPRILIYTPTLGVGVSIDETTQRMDEEWQELVPYFDYVYGLFFGVIEPSQCRQQLARVRANVPRIVWSKDSNKNLEGCPSFFPDEIKRQTLKYSHEALSILDLAKGIAGYEADDEAIREAMIKLLNEAWDAKSKCWKDPSLDLYAALKARENYSLWNLANVLREELQDEGHTVISIEGVKTNIVGEIAQIKDDLKMQEATLTAQSPTMPLEEARQISSKLGATDEEKRSAQKTLLQEELPDLNLTPEFIYKSVVKDRRRWLNQHKLFWYYSNFEAVKSLDTDHWLRNLRKFVQGKAIMSDIRSFSPKAKAIRESGVLDFINLQDTEKIYQGDTEDAQKFLLQALKAKDLLQTALNITVTPKSEPIAVANRIISKVGLCLNKVTRSKKDNRYRLVLDLVNDPDRLAVLTALELRWQKSLEIKSQQATEVGGEVPVSFNINPSSPPNFQEQSQGVCETSADALSPTNLENLECQISSTCNGQKSLEIKSQQATEVGGEVPVSFNINPSSPPSFQGQSQGFCQPLEAVTSVESSDVAELIEALPFVETADDFAAVVEGSPREAIEKAIALADSAPQRRQLGYWYQQLSQASGDGGEKLVHEGEPIKTRPTLLSYAEGDEVWAYFPQSEAKWLKASVEWARDRLVKVKSGFLGMLIEREDAIAPGDWLLSSMSS